MRLHRLSMTAFGPFAGTEVVDFDALAASGLFLLHGPTGAGKTSVLDAVCYALYGQVPGARAGARLRLRSDHAPDDRQPSVQLEVTLGARRLEVTRSPEWVRPKKRGAGVTTAPATTHVRELVDGSWRPLTTRNDEAAQLLLDLVGMGHEQFTKVVLLPQGDFAAFLRADAEQRRQLLGRLFAVDLFAGAETWIGDERRRLATEVEQADQRTAGLIARATEAFAGMPDTDEGEVHDTLLARDDRKPAHRVSELLERATALTRAAEVGLETCTERATRARARLVESTDLRARRSRWSEATLALAAIDELNDGHVQAVAVVAAARRAAPLSGLIESFDAARARADEAAAAVASAARVVEGQLLHGWLGRGRVQPGPADPDQLVWDDEVAAGVEAADGCADHDPEGLRALVAAHRTALGALEGAPARMSELSGLIQRIELLQTQGARAFAAAAAARATAEAAAAAAVTARQAQQAAAVAAADLPAALQAGTRAAQVLELVAELQAGELTLADAQALRVVAVDAEQAAREHLLSVRELRLDSYAGELAQALVSGQACLVCGSPEHPAPAMRGARHVGRAEETAAATAAQTAAAARTETEDACARLLARRHELLGSTGGRDLAAARADLAAAAERVALGELAELECRRQTGLVADADRLRSTAEATAQECGADHDRCAAAAAELDQRQRALAAELDRLRGDDTDVVARSRRLTAEVTGAETLLRALDAAESVDLLLDEHRARLVKALHENGFVRVDDARAAVLPSEHLDQLTAVVAERERQRGDLLALLAAPDLVGVGSLDEPDLAAVGADVLAADQAVQRAASAAALARQGQRRLAGLLAEVTDAEDDSAPLRERAQRVDELAACVAGTGGGNALRMRLSAYVLAARLEEVAAAATERLGLMSDGRYALVHSDERGKGGGRSGLGLRVVDAWTGSERDTATLSGGESFLASLALALGLADVVQAEAGGGVIETLFVDEGFGSLDEETLEEVMSVLDDLRGGGRAVGLVSHVADLRARIPSQLEVRKTRTGSTVHVNVPA